MKKILIVDDQAENVKVISNYITQFLPDSRILQTLEGEAALRIAMKELPDLIISDWEMPGLDGIDILNFLRSDDLTEKIPVIIVTGVMLTSENLSTAMKAGAIDFIRKPIIPIELQAKIESIFRMVELFEKEKEQQKIILQKETELAAHQSEQLAKDLERERQTLAKTTIELVQNCELNKKMIEELKTLPEECTAKGKAKVYDIIRDYQSSLMEQSWQQFEVQFSEVHKEFENNLNERFPKLTPNEKRLCTFLRLNMTTKDIASITYADVNSINVARTRLRKKLGLDREENLITFLGNI